MLTEELPNGVSVVVPVYQGSATLEELVERLVAVLDEAGGPYEIILVNDGSTDDSWDRIVKLSDSRRVVHGLDLLRNFGQHNALLAGLRAARYSVTVTLDDDLQHPPEELTKLLAALTADVDVVYGAPERNRQHAARGLASFITRVALQRVMGVSAARHVSAFRAFRTHLRRAFDEFSLSEFSLDVLLGWGTQRFSVVRVTHERRREGTSNYTTRALLMHSINMITGFTVAPLRVASFLGIAFVGVGLGLLLYVIVYYVTIGTSVPGFAFIAASVALFAGIQLFVLGVIGEYLAKMYQRSLGQPPYAVRASVGDRSPSE